MTEPASCGIISRKRQSMALLGLGGARTVKFGKVPIIFATAWLSIVCRPVVAGDTVSVVSHHAQVDGQPRQIAAALPINRAIPPIQVHPVAGRRFGLSSYSASIGSHKVSIEVPTHVDEAADYCVVTAKRLRDQAAERAVELGTWLGALAKQMGSTPTITPGGSIYEHPPVSKPQLQALNCANNRLWYMPDGRVKTAVQR